jgi:hypothetical protein
VPLCGEEVTLEELAWLSGTPKTTIRYRLGRGMSAERAAFSPRRGDKDRFPDRCGARTRQRAARRTGARSNKTPTVCEVRTKA